MLCVFQIFINFSTHTALIQMYFFCHLALLHRFFPVYEVMIEYSSYQTILNLPYKILNLLIFLFEIRFSTQIPVLQSFILLLIKPDYRLWHWITFAIIEDNIIPYHTVTLPTIIQHPVQLCDLLSVAPVRC